MFTHYLIDKCLIIHSYDSNTFKHDFRSMKLGFVAINLSFMSTAFQIKWKLPEKNWLLSFPVSLKVSKHQHGVMHVK